MLARLANSSEDGSAADEELSVSDIDLEDVTGEEAMADPVRSAGSPAAEARRMAGPFPVRTPSQIADQLEAPTALDRALAAQASRDPNDRVATLRSAFDAVEQTDRSRAAVLAYELGEIYARGKDHQRTDEAFGRSFTMDPSLRSNLWARRRVLYEREDWSAVAALIDAELRHAVDDHERAGLLLERAIAESRRPSAPDVVRTTLEAAVQSCPEHLGALFELERTAARANDTPALLAIWEQLATGIDQPEQQIAYWLDIAHATAEDDPAASVRALEAASQLSRNDAQAECVAREGLHIASAHGSPADLDAALESLTNRLLLGLSQVTRTPRSTAWSSEQRTARVREIVALCRWRAELEWPATPRVAFGYLEQALALAPNESVVLTDLVELAAELGLYTEIEPLAQAWTSSDSEGDQIDMLSFWCAEAHRATNRRRQLRAMLATVEPFAPRLAMLFAAADCEAVTPRPVTRDLAESYRKAGCAAFLGMWLGPGTALPPDQDAAIAHLVQAADLLVLHVGSHGTHRLLEEARQLLDEAFAIAPDSPLVLEASTDLDELTGRAQASLDRLTGQLSASPCDRIIADRAIRLARTHGLLNEMCSLQRRLVSDYPDDVALAWRLEATLSELGHDDERAALLTALARADPDPARRHTAQLFGARLNARLGAPGIAIDLYRARLAESPQDVVARALLLELLRSEERWVDLAAERFAEAHVATSTQIIRRALREASWTCELRLGDVARAAECYDEWLARVPGDRTALEGIARCRAALGQFDKESIARASIASIDGAAAASWLHARSLERSGRYDQAAVHYRALIRAEEHVVATSAVLALGDLAVMCTDSSMGLDASDALARRTTDRILAVTLFEECGWIHALDHDIDEASVAFSHALEIEPSRTSALLGAVLTAAARTDPAEIEAAYGRLATMPCPPEIAAAAHLRASAFASARGDSDSAKRSIAAAHSAHTDHGHARFLSAELGATIPVDPDDPFVSIEALIDHAEILTGRSALAEDPSSWELDRADTLERAGQLDDAVAAVAVALRAKPGDRRALAALRQLARRAGDLEMGARASYSLARVTRHRSSRLELLRSALEVFGRSGATHRPDLAIAICREIVSLDPDAADSEQLFDLLHERGDNLALLGAITERLEWLARQATENDERLVTLLLRRATLLHALDRAAAASADVAALLAYAPTHRAAQQLRTELGAKRRPGDDGDDVGRWESEVTDAESLPQPTGPHAVAAGFPRTPTEPQRLPSRALEETPDPFAGDTAVVDSMDPFRTTTVVADLSELQEQERRTARQMSIAEPRTSSGALSIDPRAATEQVTIPAEALRAALACTPPKLDILALDLATTADASAGENEPLLDIDTLQLALQEDVRRAGSIGGLLSFEQLQPDQGNELAVAMLRYYEAELDAAEPSSLGPVHLEAGRVAEALGDTMRAGAHFESALLLDPGAVAALRGLRRLAWARGDLLRAAELAAIEAPRIGARERAELSRHRIDLLLAIGELGLARIAVHEVLATAPTDLGALLALLELAFVDRRADELGDALERLARILTDDELRAATQAVRGLLAARAGDTESSSDWVAAARVSDPRSPALRLRGIRGALAKGDRSAARAAMLDLAYHVEGDDPQTAAALVVRAQAHSVLPGTSGTDASREDLSAAVRLVVQAAPRDPLVARIASEIAVATGDLAIVSHAFAHWARSKSVPVERAYAAARTAELEPARLGRLWAEVLELDPGDDHATAQVRAAHIRAGELEQALALDLTEAEVLLVEPALLRAADTMMSCGRIEAAIEVLVRLHRHESTTGICVEELARALASAGRWGQRANLWSTVASRPLNGIAQDIARRRCALACERAADVAITSGDMAEIERTSRRALAACAAVLENDPLAPEAHGGALLLASRIGDRGELLEVLARAEAAERLPWARSSLALRRARLVLDGAPKRAHDIARDAVPDLLDPRRTLLMMVAGLMHDDVDAAIDALEHRATAIEVRGLGPEARIEPTLLRLRGAAIALDRGLLIRAGSLLKAIDQQFPGAVTDLQNVADQIAGERTFRRQDVRAGSFVRLMREAKLAASRGIVDDAIQLYQQALAVRPGDPLASLPLLHVARRAGAAAAIEVAARDLLHAAELRHDAAAIADGHGLLARVAKELRHDDVGARLSLETALQADVTRMDIVHRLERDLASSGQLAAWLELRTTRLARHERASDGSEPEPRWRAALLADTASMALREGCPTEQVVELYRKALELAPRERLALFHLESIMLRAGASNELAEIQTKIARYFEDPRAEAAFLTRAGETLAKLGNASAAVARFTEAVHAVPDYESALDGWRDASLRGGLWNELAEVSSRQADLSRDPDVRAALDHLAGVVLMDAAKSPEQAIAALRRVATPSASSLDAFVRLRILLRSAAKRDDLAELLRARLEHERDPAAQLELHRALAEHYFAVEDVANRRTSLRYYRAILASDPWDVRAHAAIADIASAQLDRETATEAVIARITLEHDEDVLYSLHFRLAEIYARDDRAQAARYFEAALAYRPGDPAARSGLARLNRANT